MMPYLWDPPAVTETLCARTVVWVALPRVNYGGSILIYNCFLVDSPDSLLKGRPGGCSLQYLRRKALGLPLPAAVIPDVGNLYSLDPWDIPGACDGEKYFFAVRPAAGKRGGATATASGCWKPAAGGRERPVVMSRCGRNHLVGVKKSMAFVPRRNRTKGRKTTSPAAPVQTGWVMHEYRLALPLQHKNVSTLVNLP